MNDFKKNSIIDKLIINILLNLKNENKIDTNIDLVAFLLPHHIDI